MRCQWYYSHDGVTHGPFSGEEIKEHAARKILLEGDWLWQGDSGQTDAVPASAALDFSQLGAAGSPIPDWLADVATAESKGPLPGPLPSNEIPEWLDDLRLRVGLDLYTPATQKEGTPLNPALTGETPDWLESWLTPEKSKVLQQDQAPPAPLMPAIPLAVPVSPPPSDSSVPVSQPAQPALPSPVPRVFPPAETKTAAAKPVNPLVERTLQVSGFDVETGQILDPAKFRKWKQQQAQTSSTGQPAASNASLFEIFRKARTAIEAWVDNETSRFCIMQTDLEEIKRKPEIQVILHEYANYGKDMGEKLLRHLEFIVENRRKYYNALGKGSTR